MEDIFSEKYDFLWKTWQTFSGEKRKWILVLLCLVRWRTIKLRRKIEILGIREWRKVVFFQNLQENVYKRMKNSFPPKFFFLNSLSNQAMENRENHFPEKRIPPNKPYINQLVACNKLSQISRVFKRKVFLQF